MQDYYQLELDDMVIALNNKDAVVELLQKKLEIATRALKKYESATGWGREVFLALKEMEGVK